MIDHRSPECVAVDTTTCDPHLRRDLKASRLELLSSPLLLDQQLRVCWTRTVQEREKIYQAIADSGHIEQQKARRSVSTLRMTLPVVDSGNSRLRSRGHLETNRGSGIRGLRSFIDHHHDHACHCMSRVCKGARAGAAGATS